MEIMVIPTPGGSMGRRTFFVPNLQVKKLSEERSYSRCARCSAKKQEITYIGDRSCGDRPPPSRTTPAINSLGDMAPVMDEAMEKMVDSSNLKSLKPPENARTREFWVGVECVACRHVLPACFWLFVL
uniref:Uncharacterized protein n=1 Tax=Oryza brachyantha TaxID=4533 RepID=J3MKL0_ORYBR